MQIIPDDLRFIGVLQAHFHGVLDRFAICDSENVVTARFVGKHGRARHNQRVLLGVLNFTAHVTVEQELCSFREGHVNIHQSRRRIDPTRDQPDRSFHLRRGRIVYRKNRYRCAGRHCRQIFRFHAELHLDFIFRDDLDQWTTSGNDLSVLRINLCHHPGLARANAIVGSGPGAL